MRYALFALIITPALQYDASALIMYATNYASIPVPSLHSVRKFYCHDEVNRTIVIRWVFTCKLDAIC